MMKSDLLISIAALPEGDPKLLAIEAALHNHTPEQEAEESLIRLKDVAAASAISASWLHRLGVPERLGIQFAGSRRYRFSEVSAWLRSEECQVRVAELRKERKVQKGVCS